jgi:EAL domain-containing protein (putative c-di-GMP-specific phosphodiesterase class I)
VSQAVTVVISAPVGKVVAADPTIADAQPITDSSIYLVGKNFGTTTVNLFSAEGKPIGLLAVEVGADTADISSSIRAAVPSAKVSVSTVNGRVRLSGTVPDLETMDKVLTVVAQYGIPRALPEALVEGFAWDASGRVYEDIEDLHGYGARVAGSVGAMMALLMGARGAEALARWTRPDGSIVSPMVFIPAAEENGLIDAISDAILRDACWKAAAWAREGLPAHVAVNISSLQFNDLRFAQKILRTLEQSGLESRLLQLEVTESVAMKDVDRVASLIEPLRARGVQFAIDDFGTGHSSLAALTHLPFDLLKIDQQFIRGLAEDRHAPAIVETILAMAASVNYDTVAEGVETEEQAAFLRLRGCATAQGYLYGPALPPADFLALLRRNKQGVAADLDGKGAVA